MKIIVLFLLSIFGTISALGQSPQKTIKKLAFHPVFFIDSINIDGSELSKYDSTNIAYVNILKGSKATELYGEDGKDGAIHVFTKRYATTQYWTYFRTKSSDYKRLVVSPQSDTLIQYILNKQALRNNFEGKLFLINDTIFKSIQLLTKRKLQKKYNIFDKYLGFKIKTVIPNKRQKKQKES
ncbi:MAG: hypothetical protein V9F01_05670 [Chitinophagaceae bacterium]